MAPCRFLIPMNIRPAPRRREKHRAVRPNGTRVAQSHPLPIPPDLPKPPEMLGPPAQRPGNGPEAVWHLGPGCPTVPRPCGVADTRRTPCERQPWHVPRPRAAANAIPTRWTPSSHSSCSGSWARSCTGPIRWSKKAPRRPRQEALPTPPAAPSPHRRSRCHAIRRRSASLLPIRSPVPSPSRPRRCPPALPCRHHFQLSPPRCRLLPRRKRWWRRRPSPTSGRHRTARRRRRSDAPRPPAGSALRRTSHARPAFAVPWRPLAGLCIGLGRRPRDARRRPVRRGTFRPFAVA
jgi:hypothetical protein